MRREAQWWSAHRRYALPHGDRADFPFAASAHTTPLLRPLARLDERLQRNKATNLRLAAARLDGLVLAPGQRLSFWRQVGPPTYRRGYLEGLVLDHGRLSSGPGGGLCQLTNLLYWMTLHTPLTVTERWRHSYDVFPDAGRTQPFGSGATCSWPALDLQVVNDTPHAFLLKVSVTGTHLSGAWLSDAPMDRRYRIEERHHRIDHEGPGRWVRHNELWRIVEDEDGAPIAEHRVAVNDALLMYEPFLPPAPGM